MKIRKTLVRSSVLAFVLSLSLISCGDNDSNPKTELQEILKEADEANNTTQKVSSDSLMIEMELPRAMIETQGLSKDIPFQYYNGDEETYIIGNRESVEIAKYTLQYMDKFDKSKNIKENYLNLTLDLMAEKGTVISNKSDIKKVKAKNAEGIMVRLDGKLSSIIYPITYWVACFEAKGNVYKFIFWTMADQKVGVDEIATKAFESIKFK